MNTDDDWEWYGREHPYFGVLADPRYRGGQLSETLWSEFLATGEAEVDRMLGVFPRHLQPLSSLHKALDFGCGVGRLAIPLARRFDAVVGVDVSESMLREAQRNADRLGQHKLRWCRQLSELHGEAGSFSFVNTLIVLQHIAPARGLDSIREMVELLAPGGSGSIQLTYGQTRRPHHLGQAPGLDGRWAGIRQRWVALGRRLRGRAPGMQMNPYPLNQVMYLLQSHGVRQFFAEFTDHGGHLGLTVYFSKPS